MAKDIKELNNARKLMYKKLEEEISKLKDLRFSYRWNGKNEMYLVIAEEFGDFYARLSYNPNTGKFSSTNHKGIETRTIYTYNVIVAMLKEWMGV